MEESSTNRKCDAVAIIPARGGSKRIPGKNTKLFCGKPIIAYSIEVAKRTGLFSHVVVSTDDQRVVDVAKEYGAEIPFIRPALLADDWASTDDVLTHAVDQLIELYQFKYACCIYPTSPLLTEHVLQKGYELLIENCARSSFPIVKYECPIDQAFRLDGIRPRPRWPDLILKRSQDCEENYHDTGLLYWFDIDKNRDGVELFNEDAVAYEVAAGLCQDINTPADWDAAEFKYQYMNR